MLTRNKFIRPEKIWKSRSYFWTNFNEYWISTKRHNNRDNKIEMSKTLVLESSNAMIAIFGWLYKVCTPEQFYNKLASLG